MNTVVMM